MIIIILAETRNSHTGRYKAHKAATTPQISY